MRRDLIQNSMQQSQRLVLEEYGFSLRNSNYQNQGPAAAKFNHRAAEHDDNAAGSRRRQRGGVCRCIDCGKVFGYYAKIRFQNLVLWGCIHRNLSGALADHIILAKITEHMSAADSSAPFPARVLRAVAEVLKAEGLQEAELLRGVSVGFSAQHWLGRGLTVRFPTAKQALEAWRRLEEARGPHLWDRNGPLPHYSVEFAERQWQRLRQVLVELQLQGMRKCRQNAPECLDHQERRYRSTFLRKAAAFQQLAGYMRRHGGSAARRWATTPKEGLRARCEGLLRDWDRAIAHERLRQRRARHRQQREIEKMNRKRRWNGKESLEQFERRLRQPT